jgi:hypothetical protein
LLVSQGVALGYWIASLRDSNRTALRADSTAHCSLLTAHCSLLTESDIQIPHIKRIVFDEFAAGFHLIAH